MHEQTSSPLVHLHGVIDRFVFHNEENGYTVCTIKTASSDKTITAAGTLSASVVGQEIELIGSWVMHKKYGKQFAIQHYVHKVPTTADGLKKYLGSGLIKGIGESYAQKMVDHFGQNILEIIEKFPERLEEVPGIGMKRAQTISASWGDHKAISHIMIFLQQYDVSPAYAAKIYKQYGAHTIAKVQENPYRLAEDVWGIGFKLADTIAQKLGFHKESIQRISAGILYALQHHAQLGHLYCPETDLVQKSFTLLELEETVEYRETMTQALRDLQERQKIVQVHVNEIHYIGLSMHYATERALAQKIHDLLSFQSILSFDFSAIYEQLRNPAPRERTLHEDQQKGIMGCLQQKFSIITGGPGTGKTTLVKKLLAILEDNKIVYKLAAPTGKAAKRMSEATGRYATTVHRLLEIDPQTFKFVHNEQHALKIQFLIVDEASMLDIFLAHALLKAVSLTTHVIFLGDTDQLPSVGAGNFLHDCLAFNGIPHIRLTHIFRQAQDSLITVNAHKIIAGEPPVRASAETRNDFIFIKEEFPENIQGRIVECLKHELITHAILPSECAIITPMNRGAAGTITLNHMLQNYLNGNSDLPALTIPLTGITLKEGDKVMQIRNNYEKGVFNGDSGVIASVNVPERVISVQFAEKLVTYESDELSELVHAYAMTIHKSQGSEYDAVVIPIFMQHYTLLTRNLIYTAITRAKKLCIIIGQPKALRIALATKNVTQRLTLLQKFLTKSLP